MTLFIRSKNNRTIVDIDVWVKNEEGREFVEISVSINIEEYSKFLLGHTSHFHKEIIRDFSNISELRGWLWEKYFMGGANNPEKLDDVLNKVRKYLKKITTKYDLYYTED